MRKILTIVLALMLSCAHAQIINFEENRNNTDTLQMSLTAGNQVGTAEDFEQIAGSMSARKQFDKHLVFVLGGGRHFYADGLELNSWFTHLRYNYKLTPYVIPELFTQYSMNSAARIDLRSLLGVGTRYRFGEHLSIGTGMMYENVQMADTADQDYVRMSFYLSYAKNFGWFKINNIGYYQPYIMQLDNANLSYTARLDFNITEHVTIFLSGSIAYSKYPYSPAVGNTVYSTENGISFNF